MDKYLDVIKEFKNTHPAHIIIANALKEILPVKGNRFGFILSLLLAAIFSVFVSHSLNTVEITKEIASTLLGIQLAVFGCVFAVYSILLAFLSDSFIKKLGRIKENNSYTQLKNYTSHYESVLFLYFVNVGESGALMLFCQCIDLDFRLTNCGAFNIWSSCLLLFLYFGFSFRVFYELKSTIYNTVCLFRASIAYKFIDFADEEIEKAQDKNSNIK